MQLRVTRSEEQLPPPLPLISLPDEVRLAKTGLFPLRPSHLPIRRHIIEAADNRPPEPILVETCEPEYNHELGENFMTEYTCKVPVYEYNCPEAALERKAPLDTLEFDSLFESGNLLRAERILEQGLELTTQRRQEYELYIHPDVKNSAYRQWFYFEVRNMKPGTEYRFSLVNMAKSDALYGSGLQPVVYSEIEAQESGVAWVHACTDVRYQPADALNPDTVSAAGEEPCNVLSFKYEFLHEDDRVYFACLQPYTYTDLVEYLDDLQSNPDRCIYFRRTELCQTIAQNVCDLLTITSMSKYSELPQDDRRVIVISARVHPGESNSSWMMKGMIDYLTGPTLEAQVLRDHFIFKIVPMLNPDGVINGNTRVNLAGWDLNRKWSCPVDKLFPTVYHLKRQISTYQLRNRVAIYCDLHGHSINRNIFTYGCYKKANKSKSKGDPRIFPMVVAKNSRFFSFDSCDFKVQKSKVNTARVVVNQELGVVNSYTLEASFCGPDFGPRKDTQFSTWDLEEMGRTWCQSLLVYFNLLPKVKELEKGDLSPKSLTNVLSSYRLETKATSYDDISTDILRDCESVISALYSSCRGNDSDSESKGPRYGRHTCVDSDLSDAEDEPLPPTGDVYPDVVSTTQDGVESGRKPPSNGKKKVDIRTKRKKIRPRSIEGASNPKRRVNKPKSDVPRRRNGGKKNIRAKCTSPRVKSATSGREVDNTAAFLPSMLARSSLRDVSTAPTGSNVRRKAPPALSSARYPSYMPDKKQLVTRNKSERNIQVSLAPTKGLPHVSTSVAYEREGYGYEEHNNASESYRRNGPNSSVFIMRSK